MGVLPTCLPEHQIHVWGPQRSVEGIRTSGTRVTEDWELPHGNLLSRPSTNSATTVKSINTGRVPFPFPYNPWLSKVHNEDSPQSTARLLLKVYCVEHF